MLLNLIFTWPVTLPSSVTPCRLKLFPGDIRLSTVEPWPTVNTRTLTSLANKLPLGCLWILRLKSPFALSFPFIKNTCLNFLYPY